MNENEAKEIDCPVTSFKEKCRMWKFPLFKKGKLLIKQDNYSMYEYCERQYYCGLGGNNDFC